jgi:hypothetical protein
VGRETMGRRWAETMHGHEPRQFSGGAPPRAVVVPLFIQFPPDAVGSFTPRRKTSGRAHRPGRRDDSGDRAPQTPGGAAVSRTRKKPTGSGAPLKSSTGAGERPPGPDGTSRI